MVPLFLVLCIPTRLAAAVLAKRAQPASLRILGVIGLAIATGFAAIWLTGSRTHGVETGGGPIWWNDLRPVHAALWGAFGIMAVQHVPQSYQLLLADVVVGLAAFPFRQSLLQNI